MKINFTGEIKEFEKGITLLQDDMEFTQDSSGREVKVLKFSTVKDYLRRMDRMVIVN